MAGDTNGNSGTGWKYWICHPIRFLKVRLLKVTRIIYFGFRRKPSYFYFISLILMAFTVAVAAVIAYITGFHDQPFSDKAANWGALGDFFGGLLNPAFSFAALVLLLITIQQQRRELRYSRLELERSATALTDQSDTLKIQNFETTFFNWLNLHHNIVEGVRANVTSTRRSTSMNQLTTSNTITYIGRENIGRYYRQLKEDHSANNTTSIETYKKFHHDLGVGILSHYFYNLYHLVKFACEGHDDRYIDIIRSQLSPIELVFLFYNCQYFAQNGNDKFKTLVEKTGLFKAFSQSDMKNLLFDPENDIQFYRSSAYGKAKQGLKSNKG